MALVDEALWFMRGPIGLVRFCARFVALSIKADLMGSRCLFTARGGLLPRRRNDQAQIGYSKQMGNLEVS